MGNLLPSAGHLLLVWSGEIFIAAKKLITCGKFILKAIRMSIVGVITNKRRRCGGGSFAADHEQRPSTLGTRER